MTRPFFPSIYDARFNEHHGSACGGESRTKQSFKDECDINLIMRRYSQSGVMPSGRTDGLYGDFSMVGDYLHSMNTIERARAQFSGLSSDIRARFRNNPLDMLEFVGNPSNRDEAIKLGLIDAPKPIVPVEPVVKPAT